MTISKFFRSLAAATTLAAVTFGSLAARAETVYSNPFEQVESGNVLISGSTQFATGFKTGTNPSFLDLQSVALSLATSGTTASATPIVRLFSGISAPTTLVTTLSSVGSLTTTLPITKTFTPSSSPFTLSPSTNYWVVLSANAGQALGWFLTDENAAGQNASGYTYVNGMRSTNGGTSYTANALAQVGSISVSAVPEPSTLMMAGLGITGLAVMERSRRRRKMQAEAAAAHDCLG